MFTGMRSDLKKRRPRPATVDEQLAEKVLRSIVRVDSE
jgi:hypothetical protein